MATTSRTRDSAPGKKRGTSPSINSQTSSHRIDQNHKEKSSQTKKCIPNYLKPTISSRHEVPLKKNTNDQDNHRFLRSRSFDKPPSASPGGQKPPQQGRTTGTSPIPVVPRERKLIVRSSSFSGKSTGVSFPNPVLDNRSSKTPKAVKSQGPVFSKTARKGLTASPNRKECNVVTSPSRTSSQDSTETFDRENCKREEKEIVKVECDTEVNSYVTKSENGEEVDAVHTEGSNNGEVEKKSPSDMSTCTSDDQNVVEVGQKEETDVGKTGTQGEESTENLSEDQAENCNGSPEETVIKETKMKTVAEDEEEGEDDKKENEKTNSDEEIGDDKTIVEEKDPQGEEEAGSEEVTAKGQELEVDVDEGKHDGEAANAAVSKTQEGGSQGVKKESPIAYNDVIEETASKLLEKRKNKVKALVGAFETVIDHQSGGSK